MDWTQRLGPRCIRVHHAEARGAGDPRDRGWFEVELDEAWSADALGVPCTAVSEAPPASDPAWATHLFEQPGRRPNDRVWAVQRGLAEAVRGPLSALAETWRATEAPLRPWRARGDVLGGGRVELLGIVNVTPDSFSDGGRYLDPGRAIEHGLRLAAEGAALLDIGAESTRPGAEAVSADEQIRRVAPVLRGLAAQTETPMSIDTTRAAVAELAIDEGACVVNDTSALSDDDGMADVVARTGVGVVLMHRRGAPRVMQEAPTYDHCVADVAKHLRSRAAWLVERGVAPERIVLDPGIGFGKRLGDNQALMRSLRSLRGLGHPLLVGCSRKSCLGAWTGRDVGQREAASLAAVAHAARHGVEWLRVHDVAGSRDVLEVGAVLDERADEPGARWDG